MRLLDVVAHGVPGHEPHEAGDGVPVAGVEGPVAGLEVGEAAVRGGARGPPGAEAVVLGEGVGAGLEGVQPPPGGGVLEGHPVHDRLGGVEGVPVDDRAVAPQVLELVVEDGSEVDAAAGVVLGDLGVAVGADLVPGPGVDVLHGGGVVLEDRAPVVPPAADAGGVDLRVRVVRADLGGDDVEDVPVLLVGVLATAVAGTLVGFVLQAPPDDLRSRRRARGLLGVLDQVVQVGDHGVAHGGGLGRREGGEGRVLVRSAAELPVALPVRRGGPVLDAEALDARVLDHLGQLLGLVRVAVLEALAVGGDAAVVEAHGESAVAEAPVAAPALEHVVDEAGVRGGGEVEGDAADQAVVGRAVVGADGVGPDLEAEAEDRLSLRRVVVERDGVAAAGAVVGGVRAGGGEDLGQGDGGADDGGAAQDGAAADSVRLGAGHGVPSWGAALGGVGAGSGDVVGGPLGPVGCVAAEGVPRNICDIRN